MSLQNFGILQGLTINKVRSTNKLIIQDFGGVAPVGGIGVDGDYAQDATTNEFYLKTAGVWAKTGLSARVDNIESGIRWIPGARAFTAITGLTVGALGATGSPAAVTDRGSLVFVSGDRLITADGLVFVFGGASWSAVTAPNNTPYKNGDTAFVQTFFPDASNANGVALVQWSSVNVVGKIADFDFELANTINVSAGYTPGSGNPAPSESVEAILQKIDGNVDAVNASLGTAQGASNLGAFTGGTVTDNTTVKGAIQEIVTKSRFEVSPASSSVAGVVDNVGVNTIKSLTWKITAVDTVTFARYTCTIVALANGNSGVNATLVEFTEFGVVESATPIPGTLGFTVVITAGVIELQRTGVTTNPVSIKAIRYLG